VKQWRYEPVRDERGQAIEVTMTVTVSFRLDCPGCLEFS